MYVIQLRDPSGAANLLLSPDVTARTVKQILRNWVTSQRHHRGRTQTLRRDKEEGKAGCNSLIIVCNLLFAASSGGFILNTTQGNISPSKTTSQQFLIEHT